MLLAVSVLCTLVLPSCGEKAKEPEMSRVSHVYKTTEISLPESYSVDSMSSVGGKVIVECTEDLTAELDSGIRSIRRLLLELDPLTGEYTETKLPEFDFEKRQIYETCYTPDGSILMATVHLDYEAENYYYDVVRFEDGELITLCDDLEPMFETDLSNSRYGTDFYLQDMLTDGNGNIYIVTGTLIGVFDSNMNKLFELAFERYIDSVGVSADGRVYVSYRDMQTFETVFKYINLEKHELGEDVPLPDGNLDNAKLYIGPGYDVYYNDGSAVWGYSRGEAAEAAASPVKLLDFINSDIIATGIRDLVIIDENTFLANYYEYNENGSIRELYLLNRVPEAEIPERYVVDLAVNGVNDDIINQVVRFNRSSDKYRVRLTDYQNYNTDGNWGIAEETLLNEFTANDAPDLVILSDFSNRGILLESGVFLDLYTLMDADKNFDRTMFFDSVLEPMERNGELNELITVLSLVTMAGKKANVPYESWTVNEFLDYAESLPEGKYVFSYTQPMHMLNSLLAQTLDEFIDAENGKVNFDNETFRRLLEYSKNTEEFSYTDTPEAEGWQDDRNKMYREDAVMLTEAYIYSVGDVVDTMFSFGFEDTVFVGYPTENGNGAVIQPSLSYAINKDSLVAEGAWEFIKSTFAPANDRYGRHRMSSIKENFRRNAESEMEMHYFYKYDGGTSGSTSDDFLTLFDESQGIYRDTTEADVKLVEELINGATPIPSYAQAVVELIIEDLEMYFAGDKSLDDTVRIIESRIGMYIAEHS